LLVRNLPDTPSNLQFTICDVPPSLGFFMVQSTDNLLSKSLQVLAINASFWVALASTLPGYLREPGSGS
jgi:hypothetical protein